jgi:hypothetical protein
MSAELYRRIAEDCRQRSVQASGEEDKAAWLRFAEEWQMLGEEADEIEAARKRGEISN